MSKISDYEFKGVSQQIVDFSEDVRELLNAGKYQSSVATTGIPGWSANTGEFAFYQSGSDRRLYLRAATAWLLIGGFDPTLNPSALGTANAGTGNTFSLVDHIHDGSFGTPVSIETANNAGTATTFARSDHQHLGFLQASSMQAFTSSGTWTRPSGISRVFAKIWGGGGGGGSGASSTVDGAAGSSGTNSSFAASTTGQGNGGSGGSGGETAGGGGVGGAGGTASGGGLNLTGQPGFDAEGSDQGGSGGSGFGGGGGGDGKSDGGVGGLGGVPSGGGGGGGATATTASGGGGGGAGGYAEGFFTVTGNVTVTVGTGGSPGTTGGARGGTGGAGMILVYW